MKMNIPNKQNIQTVNVIDYNSVTCVMICTAGPNLLILGPSVVNYKLFRKELILVNFIVKHKRRAASIRCCNHASFF